MMEKFYLILIKQEVSIATCWSIFLILIVITIWCMCIYIYRICKKVKGILIIDLITNVYIFFNEIKEKFLKKRFTKKNFSSNLFLGFYFNNVEAITYLFYKVKAFYIKYKIIIVIISCVVAAATIAYTAYSFYYLMMAYNANCEILISESKQRMLGRFAMFREDIENFKRQHMPQRNIRDFLHLLNGECMKIENIKEGITPIITKNAQGLEYYVIDNTVITLFSMANQVTAAEGGQALITEMPLMDPLDYKAFAENLEDAVESAIKFNQEFQEIGNIIKQQEEIVIKGVKDWGFCILIVAVCVVTGTLTYIDLPDVTPLLLIP